MKKISIGLMALALAVCGVMSTPALVQAKKDTSTSTEDSNLSTSGANNAKEMIGSANKDESSGNLMGFIKIIINVVLGIVGVIAVVMVIVGGINLTTSQGDPGKVKKAKDTILYGVIGLVIALLAFAIVNFVLGAVFTTSTTTGSE